MVTFHPDLARYIDVAIPPKPAPTICISFLFFKIIYSLFPGDIFFY